MKKQYLLFFFLFMNIAVMYSKPKRQGNLMEEYLQNQSMKWEQLPLQWNEGAFIGNGIIGAMTYVDQQKNAIVFTLDRPDVTDHRKSPQTKTSLGAKGAVRVIDYCRLDIGKLYLYPHSKILKGTLEVSFVNGSVIGRIQTQNGPLLFKAYIPRNNCVAIAEVTTDIKYEWKLKAGNPQSPRLQIFPKKKKQFKYESNPFPVTYQSKEKAYLVQSLVAGGDYATYCEKKRKTPKQSCFYWSITNEVPQSGVSLKKAKEAIKEIQQKDFTEIKKELSNWWINYFQKSFISIPDKQLENFYLIQMYKLATCSTPEGPVMDNLGTFYKLTTWPSIWWNLNVQLTYRATYATNRLSQGENFQHLMDKKFFPIMENMKASRIGDCAWVLYNYYSYMRYAGSSWQEIYQKVVPKATYLLEKYKKHLSYDGKKYHLLQTASPEYMSSKAFDDTNYNLAGLRCLLDLLMTSSQKTEKYSSAYKAWNKLNESLVDYPIQENGMLIAANVPLAFSHRHYSHLIAFYPYHLIDVAQPKNKKILEKSLEHWLTIQEGRKLAGYSYTGAASTYALLGKGEQVIQNINKLLANSSKMSIFLPNTLYAESKGRNLVIETPLSAATAINEMLLQSWRDTIRVFPAVPASWKKASFHRLRAEGGYIVSSHREHRKISFVQVEAPRAGCCYLKVAPWSTIYSPSKAIKSIKKVGQHLFEIRFKYASKVCFYENRQQESTIELMKTLDLTPNHFFGVKKGKQLKTITDWKYRPATDLIIAP